jgi:DNA-binding CsgD family transcriptional regulator
LGRIQRDLYENMEWDYISLSDPNTIKALILLRHKFQPMYYSSNNESDIFSSNGTYMFSENITLTYCALDDLIKKTKISPKQRYIVNRIMYGHDEKEISEEFNEGVQNIKNILATACRLMAENNNTAVHEAWIKRNLVDQSQYKQCTKCGRHLLKKNFWKNSSPDGRRSVCKFCEKQ